jgi:hypothetical protein
MTNLPLALQKHKSVPLVRPSCTSMDRRQDPKQLPPGYQERRRVAALDRQKNARKELANRARKLAMAAAESEGSSERATEVGNGRRMPSPCRPN